MFFQCSESGNNVSVRQNLTWRGQQACPLELCNQLEILLHENHCSPEEHDRQCVTQLRSISAWIKDHHPSNEELVCIGGRGSCVLRCLAEAATSGRWRVATTALQCLHELSNHLPLAGTGVGKASSVAACVQQEVTRLLQLHQQAPSIGHGEAVCLALRVSHAMLLLAPASLLPATFLAACRPYLFYGLPSYRSAVQDYSGGSLLQEQLDSLQSSECDQATMARPNYNNRNRRKRLRRKKTQPGSTVSINIPTASPFSYSEDLPRTPRGSSAYSRRVPPLFIPTGDEERSSAKAGIIGDRSRQPQDGFPSSGHITAMPLQLRPPDPSELNNLCLKPQWAMNSDRRKASLNTRTIKETKHDEDHRHPSNGVSSEIIEKPEAVETTVTLRDDCDGRNRNTVDNSMFSAFKISTFQKSNVRNSTEDIIASSVIARPSHSKSNPIPLDINDGHSNKEMFANSSTKHDINLKSAEDLKSNNVLDDLHVSGKNQNNSYSCYEIIGCEEIEISQSGDDDNNAHPCIPNAITITTDDGHNSSISRTSSHNFRPDATRTLVVDHVSKKNNNNSSSDEDAAGEQRVWSRSLLTARVRQSALAAVSALVTVAGPAGKMSLWVPLLCQSPSLLHCLLTEPQVPGRAAIVALLSLLLTDARQPLAAATDRTDRTAYSSLCHQLGSSVREMHGALGKVLVCERSSDAIVRTLKVLELLLGNVTYTKLAPGLLSGVVRMVRPYVSHAEAVVRANALSVIVSVLLVKPAPAEVQEMLLRYSPPGPRTNAIAAMSVDDVLAHFTASSEDTAAEWEEEEEVLDEYSEPEKFDVLSAVEAMNLETSSTTVLCSTAGSNQPQPPTSSRPNSNASRRTLLGWLVGQCIDALVPPSSSPHGQCGTARGVYVQVQLQSLKVLHALVTDHFSLVYSRLPVLQRVISHGCRTPPSCEGLADMAESGVVVEHMFPLLAAVLGVLKKECDSLLKSDATEADGGLGHHSCLVRREDEWWDGRLGLGVTGRFKAGVQTNTIASQEEDGGSSSFGGTRRSSGRRRDRELGGAVNLSDISWLPLATSLWQWALQDPLRDLLLLPVAAATTAKRIVGSSCGEDGQWSNQTTGKKELGIHSEAHCNDRVGNENCEERFSCPVNVVGGKDDPQNEDVSEGAMSWYRALQGTGETSEGARRQLVVAANTLSLLSQQVAEDIGEQHLSSVLATVLWLTNDRQPEMVAVWGVRVVGALCSLPAVQRSPLALDVITSAVVAGTRLLQDSAGPATSGVAVQTRSEPLVLDPVERGTKVKTERVTGVAQCVAYEQQQQQTAAAVNKHRLVAVSALANIAASLKNYSPRVQEGAVLPRHVTECLLEAAIVACDDKSKIRPHGVRCLGSTLGWLREVAFGETLKGDPSFGRSLSQSITWLELSPDLCARALATLIECCSNGNNMKMRWNACHALGHLLHCPLPIVGSQEWRGPVLTLLCSLLGNFPNFKVRIQACLALCGLPSRELYGAHYRSAWRALLAAATSSRNVTDYLEMRHLDDLVCQVVKGAWQLTALATAGDCAWLQPLLLEHMASLTLLLRRARSCLPPHCCVAQERALQRVTALMDGTDALTDDEVAGLRLLANLFGDGPVSLPDDQLTAALLNGGTAFLATPSTKTLP